MVLRALTLRTLSEFKFSTVGRRLNWCKACFLSFMTRLHSSLNHGLWTRFGLVEVLGIHFSAISWTSEVNDSIGSPSRRMVSPMDRSHSTLNWFQSALCNFHRGMRPKPGGPLCEINIGKWSLPQRSSFTFHAKSGKTLGLESLKWLKCQYD